MVNSTTTQKYYNKVPKSYEKFKALLPRDGFCVLQPDNFKEMMKIIHNEQDKNLQHIYFTDVIDKLFASGWGWYMRLGESLSARSHREYAGQLPEKVRTDGLKVLRMVKDMHAELKYRPNYMLIINQFIREFGSTTQSREERVKPAQEKFIKATIALKAGAKLPRKTKKDVKKRLYQNGR